MTPGRAIRSYCLHCVGGSAQDVRACDANDPDYHVCPFHPYRLGRGRPSVKTIRKFCLQCMGNSAQMVLDCETTDCLCHPYRMGRNTAYEGKETNLKKKEPVGDFSGKFGRSPQAPTHTLTRS